jgi:ubiquinol-cytochrome c reductase subunit 8
MKKNRARYQSVLVADGIVSLGSQTQRGVVTYGLSPNRQGALKGTLHAAIFNTWRRFSAQVLYFAPPLIVAYAAMNWAIER